MSHGDADSPKRDESSVWTIVVAGGTGLRFGSRKQFADLAGRSVLQRSIDVASTVSDGVVVVVPADARDEVENDSTAPPDSAIAVVAGGQTRAESVRAGLAEVPQSAVHVLVHDAARPLASAELFTNVCHKLRDGAVAVVPVVPVSDTIRRRQGGVVDRDQLVAVQTPQGFSATALRSAHESAGEATDDATLVEALGHEIELVDGEGYNQKLTRPTDLLAARAIVTHLEESS